MGTTTDGVRRRRGSGARRAAVVVAALAVTGAACSSDDDEPNAGTGDGGETAGTDGTGGGGGGGESGGGSTEAGGLLAEVQSRGTLICGVNDSVPGFGITDDAGDYSGFDIDFCRVVAAAVLGDAEAVELRTLTADQRFTALQSGEVDILIRNTTDTASRDGLEGASFAPTTFYDGQQMMVNADSGFDSLEAMDGTTVCVLQGTTTEVNLASRFATAGLAVTPLTFPDVPALQAAFTAGQCDGWTSDGSQLAGIRSAFPADAGGPEGLTILDEVFSKEPLAPAVRDGDVEWLQAVTWAVYATFLAEELEITQANLQEALASEDPNVQNLLGQPSGEDAAVLDPGLGLDAEFAVAIVEQVGNYGEIYDRNVGEGSALGLPRGLNALWNADEPGLIFAPPYR